MAVLSRTLVVLTLACATGPAFGDEPTALETEIKATYVYKFAPFVTWPRQAAGPFNICVSGDDAVIQLLPQAVAGQQVGGRSIAVRRLGDGELPDDCPILYVANSPSAAQIVDAARGKPVLTVTDSAPDHGIVQLVTVHHHVRFDIDANLAALGGLSISSKLLGLANAVTPAPQDRR